MAFPILWQEFRRGVIDGLLNCKASFWDEKVSVQMLPINS